MTIEARTLDLYERSVHKTGNKGIQEGLRKIASEEKAQLQQLGNLLEILV